MDYDFFVLYQNTPIYYTCRRLDADRFELTVVTYNRDFLEFATVPQRIVLTRGRKWTAEPKLYKDHLADLAEKVKAWEKETAPPPPPPGTQGTLF